MTTYQSNEKYLACCDSHYGLKKTLIVHTSYEDECGGQYKECFNCYFLQPIKDKILLKLSALKFNQSVEPF
jgi:hypothetical protein